MGRELDFQDRGLRNYLLETCEITGERFPEYDEWMARDEAEAEAHRKRVAEIGDDPKALLLFALEKMIGTIAPDLTMPKPRAALPPLPEPLRKPQAKQRAGRNDPCPCRSGKKFKNCCMKK